MQGHAPPARSRALCGVSKHEGALAFLPDARLAPLVPSPLAGEGKWCVHPLEWVRGSREVPLTHSMVWQHRAALSRRGRGHRNCDRACGRIHFSNSASRGAFLRPDFASLPRHHDRRAGGARLTNPLVKLRNVVNSKIQFASGKSNADRKGLDRISRFAARGRRLNPRVGSASIQSPHARANQIREERHGQGSDAQYQGKEKAEGRVEQEEEGGPRPLAVRTGAGANPARAESVREERPIKEDNGRGAWSNLAPAPIQPGAERDHVRELGDGPLLNLIT